MRAFKPVAEIALAVELLPGKRCKRFNGIDIVRVVPIFKKTELSRQRGFERRALRRGHALEIERPFMCCGACAKHFDGRGKLAPAGGVGVESAAGAKIFNAEPLAENGNVAPAEDIPEKYVSEAVSGAFGILPGESFVKNRFVLQPDGLKIAHKKIGLSLFQSL